MARARVRVGLTGGPRGTAQRKLDHGGEERADLGLGGGYAAERAVHAAIVGGAA